LKPQEEKKIAASGPAGIIIVQSQGPIYSMNTHVAFAIRPDRGYLSSLHYSAMKAKPARESTRSNAVSTKSPAPAPVLSGAAGFDEVAEAAPAAAGLEPEPEPLPDEPLLDVPELEELLPLEPDDMASALKAAKVLLPFVGLDPLCVRDTFTHVGTELTR
jgi:hypothetical protein